MLPLELSIRIQIKTDLKKAASDLKNRL